MCFGAGCGTAEAVPSRKLPSHESVLREFWLTQIWLLRSAAALYFFEVVLGESVARVELQGAL